MTSDEVCGVFVPITKVPRWFGEAFGIAYEDCTVILYANRLHTSFEGTLYASIVSCFYGGRMSCDCTLWSWCHCSDA